MAQLPEETTTTVFNLMRRLLQISDRASAAGFFILDNFGETKETIPDLDLLQNVKEQVRANYTRLCKLLFDISESRPVATFFSMNSLEKPMEKIQAIADSLEASLQEIESRWNL